MKFFNNPERSRKYTGVPKMRASTISRDCGRMRRAQYRTDGAGNKLMFLVWLVEAFGFGLKEV